MANKPRGLGSEKKLLSRRRRFKWSQPLYKRKKRGLYWKSNPLGKSSQAKGIVLEKRQVEAKQPNSAMRKCVIVQLTKNSKKIRAFAPGNEAIKKIDEHDEVIVECIGGSRGRSKGDLPGTRWQVIKVNDQSLDALLKGKIEKGRK
ncbi:MAG: 30S ribosomal protein S12 [Nanoarchaeota archaeon]|nr:30S ribosomal protein S12 [Nanoarchaeota archaeon]